MPKSIQTRPKATKPRMSARTRVVLEREVTASMSGAAPALAGRSSSDTSPTLPATVLAMLPPSAAKQFMPTADDDQPAQLWAVANLIRGGSLPPEAIASFPAIEIAPGVPVQSSFLRWHPVLCEIVYFPPSPLPEPDDDPEVVAAWPSPEGRYVRLSAISNLLQFNTVATGWAQAGDDNSAERFSVELGATVKVMRASRATERFPWLVLREQTGPGDWFVVRTEEETLDLVDIDDPDQTPQFRSLKEAIRMADAAILHETTLPDGADPIHSAPPPRLRWLLARPRPRWWNGRWHGR